MKSAFLDEQIMELYDDYQNGGIDIYQLSNKHAEAVSVKLNNDPSMKNLKRIVNSLNLAVDQIKKKYGYSVLKKISYQDLYNKIFT